MVIIIIIISLSLSLCTFFSHCCPESCVKHASSLFRQRVSQVESNTYIPSIKWCSYPRYLGIFFKKKKIAHIVGGFELHQYKIHIHTYTHTYTYVVATCIHDSIPIYLKKKKKTQTVAKSPSVPQEV